ncbi:helix-turn-helix domain-containing protein [Haloarcula sp. JP-L23]|uniref:helix-turn-helix domain-containing protein n=1 Tax=Haloarcula sp. JP-L23 TaxID=2716717 RepID=UPI001D047191
MGRSSDDDDTHDRRPNQQSVNHKTGSSPQYSLHPGYYAWPRESTAEDLAETMDIASSTLHYHLRHALHQLLTVFFEQECL